MTAEIQTAITVTDDQEKAIEAGRLSLLSRAEALVVDSAETEQTAWAVVNAIGELKKRIQADFAPAKAAAHAAHKAVCDQESGHLDGLKRPDQIVRGKLSAWEGEKRRRQAEAERIAREKAMAEAKAAAEEQARKEAEERQLQEAVEAETKGDAEKAETILNTPIEVAPVEVPAEAVPIPFVPPAPKVDGAGAMVEVWHFEVVSPADVPREYLTVNEVALGIVVKGLKGHTNIPGVRVWSTLEPRRTGGRG